MLAIGACKEDPPKAAATDDKPAEAADTKAEPEAKPSDTPEAKPDAKPGGLGADTAALIDTAKSAAAGAPLLPHDKVLGHFMMGNTATMMKKVKEQLAPPSLAGMVDVEAMKALAAGQLGPKGEVVRKIDLEKPFGCAMVDSKVHEAPVACVVGYEGGAEALVADLGPENKAPDGKGHVAAYNIDGETVFIDALDDQVVLSPHAEIFDLAKGYLKSNIVDRGSESIADVELVMYPNNAAKAYAKEMSEVFEAFDEMQKETEEFGGRGLGNLRDRVDEMQQFTIGLELSEAGFTFSTALHATKGSELATTMDTTYAGRMNKDFVAGLPSSTFAFAGAQGGSDPTTDENFTAAIDGLSKAIAEELELDQTKIKTEIDAFIKEEGDLYSRDLATGLMFVEGTLGGAILTVGKKAPGRDKWKAWTERFVPDAILPEEGLAVVTWDFQPAGASFEGVEIDRWVIKPTAFAKKKMAEDKDPDLKAVLALWPDLELTIDRAEFDDRVVFVVSPVKSDAYTKSAVLAVNGTSTIRDHEGYGDVEARAKNLVGLYAVDVAGGVNWLRSFLPPDATKEIPSPLGVDLSDVTLLIEHPAPGVVAGSLSVSQPFVDQLRKLAEM
ncbi:MAG: hypothetical protein AAGA54_14295 [Myxococcota bacterium]